MPSFTPKPNLIGKGSSIPVPVCSSRQNWKQSLIDEKKKLRTANSHCEHPLRARLSPTTEYETSRRISWPFLGKIKSTASASTEQENKNKEEEENKGEKKTAEDAEQASAADSTTTTTTTTTTTATAAGPRAQGEGAGRGVELRHLIRAKTE
ncbi:hypothetical protein DL767_007803 [Monosporascus sp. MG133]|nr:hypothetical protein DL767_007803 [Monosporascus sp. MG133]